ncbi:MAG: hypothetical protein ACM3PS_11835 [Syntrophothermus sp.]
MKRTILLLTVLLAACSPFVPQQPAPSLPTAYIDPSYPTMESQPVTKLQQSNGIDVTADRAWRDGKQVNVDVCYTLLDDSNWSIGGASLQYAGTSVIDFGSTMLSLQEPTQGQSGKRCETLSFVNIPPDADLSNVVVTIDTLAAPPGTEEYCSIYMPKIQQALNDRGIAITLDCPTDANGVQSLQITSKPSDMSQEQAEQIVFSDEFYSVKGPWSFTFNLGQ